MVCTASNRGNNGTVQWEIFARQFFANEEQIAKLNVSEFLFMKIIISACKNLYMYHMCNARSRGTFAYTVLDYLLFKAPPTKLTGLCQ